MIFYYAGSGDGGKVDRYLTKKKIYDRLITLAYKQDCDIAFANKRKELQKNDNKKNKDRRGG